MMARHDEKTSAGRAKMFSGGNTGERCAVFTFTIRPHSVNFSSLLIAGHASQTLLVYLFSNQPVILGEGVFTPIPFVLILLLL